uniref:Uncharacterized protein n=1 Tax=Rhizobium phage LG08 TaxID=3129229 RepID=A0AAU8HXT1_9CAUD
MIQRPVNSKINMRGREINFSRPFPIYNSIFLW